MNDFELNVDEFNGLKQDVISSMVFKLFSIISLMSMSYVFDFAKGLF